MSIIMHGKNVNKKHYHFQEKIETATLIEGCLHAVESVTQNISTENFKKVNTNLANLLSQDCLDRFRANMPNEDNLKHIVIHKEDVLFSWVKNYDEKALKIQICTISFPSYNYLRVGVLNRRQKGKKMANDLSEEYKAGKITPEELIVKRGEQISQLTEEFHDFNDIHKHLDFDNDMIVSNWDFVQENGDWKIEGMVMKRLKQCLTKPFYWRWRQRLRSSIIFDRDFTGIVLRG